MTDTLGFATRYTVNGLGQTTQVTDQQGRLTQMGYDGAGLLRWTKRPDGQVTVYQVDGLGRVVTTIVNYQDGIVATNEPVDQDLMSRTLYDQAGRRLSALDPAGRLTHFIFDNLDRLTYVAEYGKPSCIDWQICTVPLTWIQYGYDRAGNRTTITDAASHSRSVTYDAADEQKQALDPLGFTTV
jgi:YD repeat-containing protein